MLLKLLIFSKRRHFEDPLKTFFVKKNCGFVDSEFVKICHEQVNYTRWFLMQYLRQTLKIGLTLCQKRKFPQHFKIVFSLKLKTIQESPFFAQKLEQFCVSLLLTQVPI